MFSLNGPMVVHPCPIPTGQSTYSLPHLVQVGPQVSVTIAYEQAHWKGVFVSYELANGGISPSHSYQLVHLFTSLYGTGWPTSECDHSL